MLKVSNINVYYGGIHALHDISLEVNHGEIVSIIGANGAGKSTLLKAIAGIKPAANGEISFQGEKLPAMPHHIVRKGVVLVPEGRKIFANLTVRENLAVGAFLQKDNSLIARTEESILALFPVLKERYNQMGGTLSGGQQQMLAVGRALMSQPKLLMLDEPSLGLAPVIVDTLFDAFLRIRSEGITVLVVEQNAMAALELSDRAYVLQTGRMVKDGRGKELLEDPNIRSSYLGGSH